MHAPRNRRRLARQAAAALDVIDAAIVGDDPERALAAVAIVALLDRRSVHRDVRTELIAAAEVLRLPPARPMPRGMLDRQTPSTA